MTFGSLFAGIGGFDLGLERAGMRCAWQVEIDPHCRRVLGRHFPGVARLEDVTAARAGDRPGGLLSKVDLVCGGFPCQDLSVAGRRAGIGGARSGLFYEMARIVDELRPAWLLWENVPGLLSSGAGRDFLAVLAHLDGLGYGGAWTTVDARYFGLAQQRRRIFGLFAAGDTGARRAAEVLAIAARLPGHPAPRRAPGPGVAASLRSRSASRGVNLPGRGGEDDANLVAHTIRSTGEGDFRDGASDNLVAYALRSADAKRGDDFSNVVPDLSPCLQERGGKGPDSDCTQALIPCALGENGRGEVVLSDTARSLHGSGGKPGQGYAAALVARPHGADDNDAQGNRLVGALRSNPHNNSDPTTEARMHVQTAMGVRRLTPRECERLQGFPDGWTGGEADTHRYRMLGNAVPVPVAEWIGRRLMALEPVPSGTDRILTEGDG